MGAKRIQGLPIGFMTLISAGVAERGRLDRVIMEGRRDLAYVSPYMLSLCSNITVIGLIGPSKANLADGVLGSGCFSKIPEGLPQVTLGSGLPRYSMPQRPKKVNVTNAECP